MNGIEILNYSMGLSSQMLMGLAEDLREHPMRRVCENGNHALWIMGHLAFSEAHIHRCMTGEPNPLEHWADLFHGGTSPSDGASVYPSYDEVIQAAKSQRDKTITKLGSMTDSDLDTASANVPEGMEDFMGTVGKCMLITSVHPWHHRGQLADIRRALGREPVMG